MTKTVTDAQLIGRQGETFVSTRANAMGFMFSRYGPLEAGIDGFLEIRDPEKGSATGQLVAVQVKTRKGGSYTAETDSGFEYLMDESDVAYWQGCNLPVVVVLVHLEQGTAYWKSTDTGKGLGKRRLYINKAKDVFDVNARDEIANLCIVKSGFGTWFPPLKIGEDGHMNMLEVVFPEKIYVASSPYKTGRHALHDLLNHEERPPDDWIIRGRQFMSFRDPIDGPLSYIVDIGAVETVDTEDVVFPEEEADEHIIIDLIRRTLIAQLDGSLAYSRSQRAFYFPAIPETIEFTYQYKSLKQRTSANVVKKYEKNDKIKYVRHHAFEPRFWRIGNKWFLSITPTFVFTWDGFRPDRFAASRLAGKKQREYQAALTGQFMMWSYLLVDEKEEETKELFNPKLDSDHVLQFRPLKSLLLSRGVPDELWRSNEPELPDIMNQRKLDL